MCSDAHVGAQGGGVEQRATREPHSRRTQRLKALHARASSAARAADGGDSKCSQSSYWSTLQRTPDVPTEGVSAT